MMLAQSFFRYRDDAGRREYLKAAVQTHPVWGDAAFWREALSVCVAKQAGGDPRGGGDDDDDGGRASCAPGYGSSLFSGLFGPRASRVEQNALVSQLGAIVHAMVEFGLDVEAFVVPFIDAVADERGLDDAKRALLADHARAEAPPPP